MIDINDTTCCDKHRVCGAVPHGDYVPYAQARSLEIRLNAMTNLAEELKAALKQIADSNK